MLGSFICALLVKHKEVLRPLEKQIGSTIEELVERKVTYHEFDQLVTAPSYGFATLNDYYRKSSSVLKVHEVKVPTLFLSTLDDPMVVKDVMPYDECRANGNTILACHPSGGHLGFFTGLNPKKWFTEPVIGYIDSLENYHKAQKLNNKH
eukprot:TRINITY_DN842_c0_g2_i13.p1 TRINITY_DN842_c0_g2~~TRINITY_DN842_c0_g2_i13.p1  ORF type:complete len:150 (+),score=30.20 TRINITY_DN842_c0_g2_i13:261-710(+)